MNKTSLPVRRASDHSRPSHHNANPNLSVGQTFGNLFQLLQREAVFGLQLLLAFSVSYTAVQLTRSWISQSGMFAPAPAVYSARVFWPENTMAIFPKPQTAPAAQPPKAAARANDEPKSMPKHDDSVKLAVTRTPPKVQTTSARLHMRPAHNAYRWAAPKPRYVPRTAYRAYAARPAVRQSVRPRPVYRKPVQVAARPQPVAPSKQIQPISRMLHNDYKVSKLKSYNEYMSWVRKTLKSYNGG